MHNVRRFLAMLLVLVSLTAYGAEMNNLSDYQWKYRLILVQASSDTEGAVETLRSSRAEIDDRDIVWFVYAGSGVVSNQKALSSSLESDIQALLEQSRSDERVLLIGKDGGIKSRESSLDLDAIFRRIDGMPMRIREMRAN